MTVNVTAPWVGPRRISVVSKPCMKTTCTYVRRCPVLQRPHLLTAGLCPDCRIKTVASRTALASCCCNADPAVCRIHDAARFRENTGEAEARAGAEAALCAKLASMNAEEAVLADYSPEERAAYARIQQHIHDGPLPGGRARRTGV